jgi:hypothetical protein
VILAVPSATDMATGVISSDGGGMIETPAGARLRVPVGAVPRFQDGSVGSQTFSIERTSNSQTPPTGEVMASPVYRFGPEGFTFGAPVEVRIPITLTNDSNEVFLYRTNMTTGLPERVNGMYDHATHTFTAQTYEFCCWFGTERPHRNTANGCLHVTNGSFDHWLRICVDSYTLTYPDQDGSWMQSYGDGGLWAPFGTIGFSNNSDFSLPQGSYRLCVQWGLERSSSYVHWFSDVTINSAYDYYFNNTCQSFSVNAAPSGADTGTCVCVPHPSTPVHTGAVQVTMNWYVPDESGRDLDLHVIEPSGEEIYYGHAKYPNSSATGGQLDQDMICGNYRNGQENIYWTSNPPIGEYIVRVHFFGNCSTTDQVFPYNIRLVVLGVVQTFAGNVNVGETVEVTRFHVGSSPAFVSTQPHTVPNTLYLPPKN